MRYVTGFFRFWYDFIVGDAWEVAAGVLIALVVTAVITSTALQPIAWLVLPIIVALALAFSLYWFTRKR